MARKRPTASHVPPPAQTPHTPTGARAALTRAEEHALRRSAPLTPDQFKAMRLLAEHGVNPLRSI